jgi:hypothetical protein
MKRDDHPVPRRLREKAAELRTLADEAKDPEKRDRLLDAAAEYDGLALTGDAHQRATGK